MSSLSEKIWGYSTEALSALRGFARVESDLLELTASEDPGFVRRTLPAFAISRDSGSNRIIRMSLAHAEQQACDLARRLFRAEYANVQPQSGAQANAAAYLAALEPGEAILGLGMEYGGHLAESSHVKVGGSIYRAVRYGVNYLGLIDYEDVHRLAQTNRAKLIMAGFSNCSRFLDFRKLREIADSVEALLLIDMSHVAGLVAAGIYPSPVQFADIVTTTTQKSLGGPKGGLVLSRDLRLSTRLDEAVRAIHQDAPLNRMICSKLECFRDAASPAFQAHQTQVVANARAMANEFTHQGLDVITGGTDNHIVLLDLSPFEMTAHDASIALHRVGVVIETDSSSRGSESPFTSYHLRLATSSITARGLLPSACSRLAAVISKVVQRPNDLKTVSTAAKAISTLCGDHPVYPNFSGQQYL